MQRRISLSLIVLLLAGWLLGMPAAQAAEDCETKIVDATSQHVLGDPGGIQAALTRLDAAGADAYVRVFDATPGGSNDAYRVATVASCAAWRTPTGDMKGNLVLIMLDLANRKSSIFYGSNLPQLNGKTTAILESTMNPKLRNGDYAGAMVATSDTLTSTITPQTAPASSGPGYDWGPFWTVVLWILGVIGFVLVAVVIGLRLIARRRNRRNLLAKIATYRKSVGSRITSFPTITRDAVPDGATDLTVMEEFDLRAGPLSPAMQKTIRSQLRDIENGFNKTARTYSQLTFDHLPKQSPAALAPILATLVEVDKRLTQITKSLENTRATIASEVARVTPEQIQKDYRAIGTVLELTEQRQTELEASLNSATTRVRLTHLSAKWKAFDPTNPALPAWQRRDSVDALTKEAKALHQQLMSDLGKLATMNRNAAAVRQHLTTLEKSPHKLRTDSFAPATVARELDQLLKDNRHTLDQRKTKLNSIATRTRDAQRNTRTSQPIDLSSNSFALGYLVGSDSSASSSRSSYGGGSTTDYGGSSGGSTTDYSSPVSYDGGSTTSW